MSRGFIGTLCLSVTFALLAGCGGSSPPIGGAGAMPQTSAMANHAARGKSWMLPGAKNDSLVYAAGRAETLIYVYSYPTMKLVGQITDTSGELGLCSDSAGNVFVPNSFTNSIDEYAHGGQALSPPLARIRTKERDPAAARSIRQAGHSPSQMRPDLIKSRSFRKALARRRTTPSTPLLAATSAFTMSRVICL